MEEEFEVGLNVLVRCPGFPTWPAKLVDPRWESVPESVRIARHDKLKSKLARFYAKKGTKPELITFSWAKPKEISPLNETNMAACHPDALEKRYLKWKTDLEDAFASLLDDERGEADNPLDFVKGEVDEDGGKAGKRKRKVGDEKAKKRKTAGKVGAEEGASKSKRTAPRKVQAEAKLSKEEQAAIQIIEIMEDLHNRVYPRDDEEEELEAASDLIDKLAATKMTMALLEETKVGLLINKMRHHRDKEFAEKCYNLRKKWSRMVKQRLTAIENQKRKDQEAGADAGATESVE